MTLQYPNYASIIGNCGLAFKSKVFSSSRGRRTTTRILNKLWSKGPSCIYFSGGKFKGVREHLDFSGFFIFSGAVNKGCGSKIN